MLSTNGSFVTAQFCVGDYETVLTSKTEVRKRYCTDDIRTNKEICEIMQGVPMLSSCRYSVRCFQKQK